jgi:hypothetical protein
MRFLYFISFLIGTQLLNGQFLDTKKDLVKHEGYFDFYYSDANGEIYLEVNALDEEFLYVHFLSSGLGSNDIGLDRGQIGDGVVVKFIKSGNKILLLQTNQKYRANTDVEPERRSVEQAFAKSVLFGFQIKETRDNSYIIDLTPFLMEDAHGVIQRLKNKKEGTYKIDKNRSVLWMENTKAFPKNVEFESLITYVGEPTGKQVSTVSPDPTSITVIHHHSFVELPDNGYQPRVFDPRCGSFPMDYLDYATPIWEPIKKQFIYRHRLEKNDPNAEISEAIEPIIYYLDPGTPEPVRSALLEGASWWNQAFEKIGYRDAFQVKMLPEGADPLDIRYNVIQWVHRSTRGWSYGGTISDPRTGEILKGHVSLGSLRIRQDFMIAQALQNKPFAISDNNYQPMLELALARIRQLSAHEVGHTLGFAHNFAASTNARASVMDYPHPLIQLQNGTIDFSNAYDDRIGDWDCVTVAYSYSDVPVDTPEKTYLSSLLDQAFEKGLRYISDPDARPQSSAHEMAHLWDNGKSASDELNRILSIRKKAIEQFSIDNIRGGDPYTVLEDIFVPLYFFHRYQTEAAVKVIGGMDYNYAVKGSDGLVVERTSKDQQIKALSAIMETLSVINLSIPLNIHKLFPPRAYGYPRTRESFKSTTGVAFDLLGAPATSTGMTLDLLLHPERANRLIQQVSIEPENLSLDDVIDRLILNVFSYRKGTPYESEVEHTIRFVTLDHLMRLAADERSMPQVRAKVRSHIDRLERDLKKRTDDYSMELLFAIAQFKKDPGKYKPLAVPPIPDGSPIGSFQCMNH